MLQDFGNATKCFIVYLFILINNIRLFFCLVEFDRNVCIYLEWHELEFTARGRSAISELLDTNQRLKNKVAKHKRMLFKFDI